VQTLDGVVCSEMPELISVSKEHLEPGLKYSQTMEGSIHQVDAKALSVEGKGPSLKSLDPFHDGRRCSKEPWLKS